MSNNWYKNNTTDKVYWKDETGKIGEWTFSFDKKAEFNLFADYPFKLTKSQKEMFDAENPYWKDFFADR